MTSESNGEQTADLLVAMEEPVKEVCNTFWYVVLSMSNLKEMLIQVLSHFKILLTNDTIEKGINDYYSNITFDMRDSMGLNQECEKVKSKW